MNNILNSANKVLVLAPHPDDETLGCGGTITQYSKLGKEVWVAFISRGDAVDVKIPNIVDIRRDEAYKATQILGVKKVVFMDFPDGRLSEHNEEIKKNIRDIVSTFHPDIIFSPSPIDLHSDHVMVSKIALSLLSEFKSCKIAFYEIYSPIRYNCIIDVTEVMDTKERAMFCYKYSLLEKPDCMLYAMKGLNAFRSLDFLKKGYYEVFYWIDARVNEDEIIDWLTYGMSREASSYKFLLQLRKADELLVEYQNSLKKINELSELLRERDRRLEQLENKYDIIENKGKPDVIYTFHKIRDIILPYNTKRRWLYDTVVKKVKQ
jgi:LmbE family N-acetylglucosaminyl deacetylase